MHFFAMAHITALTHMHSYAKELAKNELNHVRFLQKVLGSKAVPCPALNIGTAFAAAADAAVGSKLSPPFDPFRIDEWFALGAFIFEGDFYLANASLVAR
jgi:Ferritin-like domain